jgi:hypothetical protein
MARRRGKVPDDEEEDEEEEELDVQEEQASQQKKRKAAPKKKARRASVAARGEDEDEDEDEDGEEEPARSGGGKHGRRGKVADEGCGTVWSQLVGVCCVTRFLVGARPGSSVASPMRLSRFRCLVSTPHPPFHGVPAG